MKKVLFLTAAIMILGNTLCYAEGTCPINPVFEAQKAESKTDVSVSDNNIQKDADKTTVTTENTKTKKEHKKRWWTRK